MSRPWKLRKNTKSYQIKFISGKLSLNTLSTIQIKLKNLTKSKCTLKKQTNFETKYTAILWKIHKIWNATMHKYVNKRKYVYFKRTFDSRTKKQNHKTSSFILFVPEKKSHSGIGKFHYCTIRKPGKWDKFRKRISSNFPVSSSSTLFFPSTQLVHF